MGSNRKGRKSKKKKNAAKKTPTKQGLILGTHAGRNDPSEVFITGFSFALTWRIILGFLSVVIIICGFIIVYYHKIATALDRFTMVKENQSCMIQLLHKMCNKDEDIEFPLELLKGQRSISSAEAESIDETFIAEERHVSNSAGDTTGGEK